MLSPLKGGIKTATVQGYICKALLMLPPDTLAMDDKKRFLAEIAAGAYILKLHRQVFRRLRKEVGDTVSDSEEEEVA